MSKVDRIERKQPPIGAPEVLFLTSRGYKTADPANGTERHFAKHAIYVQGPWLEKVAKNLDRGLLLWMKQPGKRETLICPTSLQIKWV